LGQRLAVDRGYRGGGRVPGDRGRAVPGGRAEGRALFRGAGL